MDSAMAELAGMNFRARRPADDAVALVDDIEDLF